MSKCRIILITRVSRGLGLKASDSGKPLTVPAS
mgnify:CR=1 FL=1